MGIEHQRRGLFEGSREPDEHRLTHRLSNCAHCD
jgi:hypothetical protein